MTEKDWNTQREFWRKMYEIDRQMFGEEFAKKRYELNKQIVKEEK